MSRYAPPIVIAKAPGPYPGSEYSTIILEEATTPVMVTVLFDADGNVISDEIRTEILSIARKQRGQIHRKLVKKGQL